MRKAKIAMLTLCHTAGLCRRHQICALKATSPGATVRFPVEETIRRGLCARVRRWRRKKVGLGPVNSVLLQIQPPPPPLLPCT